MSESPHTAIDPQVTTPVTTKPTRNQRRKAKKQAAKQNEELVTRAQTPHQTPESETVHLADQEQDKVIKTVKDEEVDVINYVARADDKMSRLSATSTDAEPITDHDAVTKTEHIALVKRAKNGILNKGLDSVRHAINNLAKTNPHISAITIIAYIHGLLYLFVGLLILWDPSILSPDDIHPPVALQASASQVPSLSTQVSSRYCLTLGLLFFSLGYQKQSRALGTLLLCDTIAVSAAMWMDWMNGFGGVLLVHVAVVGVRAALGWWLIRCE